jgi:hypothetical protein
VKNAATSETTISARVAIGSRDLLKVVRQVGVEVGRLHVVQLV